MDVWLWILVIELGLLTGFVVGRAIRDARNRAVTRRLVLHVFTQHPIAITTPPTALVDSGELIASCALDAILKGYSDHGGSYLKV